MRPACASGARVILRHSGPVIWSIGQDWRWESFFAYDCPARCARRIRLVAYGARLESVLGASPRGFESPILRHRTPEPAQVPGFFLCLQGKVIIVGEGCCSSDSHVFPLVTELEGNTRGTKYEISTNTVWRPVGKLSCLCCLWRRLISGRRESCPPASRPRRELRSARRLEARPGPAGLAAASNRACLSFVCCRPGFAAALGPCSLPQQLPHSTCARS